MATTLDIRGSLGRSVLILSGAGTRLALLIFAVLFLAWQLYYFGWQPLTKESELPVGVETSEARLNKATLQEIQDLRTNRVQYQPVLFTGVEQYFTVPTVSPLPSPLR